MKGLLLKDFYMAWKYCRMFVLIIAVFLAISFFGNDNAFFLFYPAILAGMIPVTLIAYEERCKWTIYCETLPLSRAQVVSCKYIISLLGIGFVIIISGIVQAIRAAYYGQFVFAEYAAMLGTLATISLLVPSLLLPLIFKLGSEKGRIAYYLVIGITCAATALFSFSESFSVPNVPYYVITGAGVIIFALSWLISIRFYQSREL